MINKLTIKAGLKPAFTMIELVFVIVVLGILAAVAIPKLAATRDDAILVKGKSQIGAIRSGIAMQKAKALLQGDNSGIYNSSFRLIRLDDVTSGFSASNSRLFNFADGNESNVLESPIYSQKTNAGGWVKNSDNNYTFQVTNSKSVDFIYTPSNGTFSCDTTDSNCLLLIK